MFAGSSEGEPKITQNTLDLSTTLKLNVLKQFNNSNNNKND